MSFFDWPPEPRDPYSEIEQLIIAGLCTDGAHHKQWYLEQIAKLLGIDLSAIDYDRGMAP